MNEIFRQLNVIDDDSHVVYRPILGGWKAELFDDQGEVLDTEYIYLNPSGGSDDGVPTVFVYRGSDGDPQTDTPLVHIVAFDKHVVTTRDRNA